MRMVTMCLAGLLMAAPLAAQEPQPEVRERQHVVRRGDTLWDLANYYYRNPFRWPVIYQANTVVVEDPHWIYPEEVLVIPGLLESVRPPEQRPVAMRPADGPVRTVFYREPVQPRSQEPTVLMETQLVDLPVKPGEFHAAEFLADPGRIPIYGRLIRSSRHIELAGHETPSMSHPHDEVYLRYEGPRPAVGDRLMLVRQGRRIGDVGRSNRVMHPTAIVEVTGLAREVIEARIQSQFGAVQRGQLLVPLDLYPDFPETEAVALDAPDLPGRIIEFVGDQLLPSRTDRAFIDRGAAHGVNVGDIFGAYVPERRARRSSLFEGVRTGEMLPAEYVAWLRVVRVGDNTATVQVDQVLIPVLEDGMRIQRIRRMP